MNPKRAPAAETLSWFVYVLRCADGSLYTGVTNDLVRRCGQHNSGTGARYTRGRRPVELVYHEPQPDRSKRFRRELAIKRLSRAAKETLMHRAG